MARVPLKYIPLHPTVRGVADREGSIYVYNYGTTTATTVFQDSTGATALTQPITYSATRPTDGWVEAGEYTIATSSSILKQDIDLQSGDGLAVSTAVNHHAPDQTLGVCTIPDGFYGCNTDQVTLTSGTVIFAKLPPIYRPIVADTFYTHVGATESASETDQRLGLYTSDGTTFTRVALTAASTTLLETDDVQVSGALTTNGTDAASYTLVPGVEYWAAILSVATTAGSVIGRGLNGIGVTTTTTETPTAATVPILAKTLAGQTALDATEAISGTTSSWIVPYIFIGV